MPEIHLSWQPGFSLSRKPKKRTITRRTKRVAPGEANGLQQFEFIAEQPARNHEARCPPSAPIITHSGATAESITGYLESSDPGQSLVSSPENRGNAAADEYGARSQGKAVERTETSIDTPSWLLNDESPAMSGEPPHLDTTDGITDPYLWSRNREDEFALLYTLGSATDTQLQGAVRHDNSFVTSYQRPGQDAAIKPSSAVASSTATPGSPSASVPPSILYNNLSQRFRPILDRCKPILNSPSRGTTQ
jgi:hypothetical protein